MLNSRYTCYSLLAGILLFSPVYGDENALLSQSRELTAKYATELQAALQQAMTAGGPVTAIGICSELAPQVASDLSRVSGAKVRRTSLRFRNPGNAPDAWETRALEYLESTNANEFFESDGSGGFRYARAIPTGAVCLACHGATLAPEIEAELSDAYPHDRARGYDVGDMRGAFSVSWPSGAHDQSVLD